jgi:hypothetical protein
MPSILAKKKKRENIGDHKKFCAFSDIGEHYAASAFKLIIILNFKTEIIEPYSKKIQNDNIQHKYKINGNV